MPKQVKEYGFNGLAGCVIQKRNRITKTLVGVYHAEQSGMEDDPSIPWMTVCEDHGRLVGHPSLRLALDHSADPTGWCGVCNGQEEPDKPEPPEPNHRALAILRQVRESQKDRPESEVKEVVKPDHFKQANPKDQLTVVVMAIAGHIDNVVTGVIDVNRFLDKSLPLLDDVIALRNWMNDEWK